MKQGLYWSFPFGGNNFGFSVRPLDNPSSACTFNTWPAGGFRLSLWPMFTGDGVPPCQGHLPWLSHFQHDHHPPSGVHLSKPLQLQQLKVGYGGGKRRGREKKVDLIDKLVVIELSSRSFSAHSFFVLESCPTKSLFTSHQRISRSSKWWTGVS